MSDHTPLSQTTSAQRADTAAEEPQVLPDAPPTEATRPVETPSAGDAGTADTEAAIEAAGRTVDETATSAAEPVAAASGIAGTSRTPEAEAVETPAPEIAGADVSPGDADVGSANSKDAGGAAEPTPAEAAVPPAGKGAEPLATDPAEPPEVEAAGTSAAQAAEPPAEKGAEPLATEPAEPPATEAAEPPAAKATKKAAPVPPPPRRKPESPAVAALRRSMDEKTPVEGKVIGWNNGGFHVVVGDLTAFCPRSEMNLGPTEEPATYVDRTFRFKVLKIQKRGRRVVLSRSAVLKGERARQRKEVRKQLEPGAVLEGTVASTTDFGAFIELGGGVQGLVHVSELSRQRVGKPSEILEPGQTVKVKVLKVEQGRKRISLSMRALEPDPWRDIRKRYPQGSTVKGRVEKATNFGAFIELEPGLTGLLPASAMAIPRQTSPARLYPPGKEVSVQVMSIDSRRQRISLALEGSTVEGSRVDYKDYLKSQRTSGKSGFNALASALSKLRPPAES